MKSVGASGIGNGSQRNWFGDVAALVERRARERRLRILDERSVHAPQAGSGTATNAGSRARGAVNAVPDNCSAYSP